MTELERFIKTGEIEISKHPLSNIRRVAKLQVQGWLPQERQVMLNFTVHYIDDNGNPFDNRSLQPYQIQLIAHSVKVDPITFNPIDPGDESYQSAKTEYDIIVDQLNDSVNAFEKMFTMTLYRDSKEGGSKFDK